MAIGRIVPWSSWKEWLAVHRGLFAQGHQQKQLALQQVAVWRCRGKVPLGIEVTACLVEILSRDNLDTSSESEVQPTSDDVLRLEYSMAIVRMVNGISDKAQKGRVATSVAQNAAAAGLPRLLVDIRHEASHNDLPSLSLLRLAAAEALQWLQAAYWQRQQEHLSQQQQHVVRLLKEYIALVITHTRQTDPPARSSPVPRRVTPIEQASTAPSAMAMQLGSPASSQKQAANSKAEAQHAQQAVLNQLKEVPVKPVNAALLVEPLLHHGLLDAHIAGAITATSADVASPQSAATVASATHQGIMQGLTSQWPALPALLLQGAVQRLTHAQCTAQQAEVMAGWVAMLLSASALPAQQVTKDKSRGSKRKSITSDQTLSAHVQHHGSFPSAAQIKKCLQTLLQGLSRATPGVNAVVRQVLSVLLEELQVNHVTEYVSWGSRAQQLAVLAQPDEAATDSADVAQQRQQDSSLQQGVAEAVHKQQKLLHSLQAESASDTTSRSHDQGWESVEDWTPCAIGAAPSAFDCNGMPPCYQQPDSNVICDDAGVAYLGLASDAQPSRNAVKTSTAKHTGFEDTTLSRQEADPKDSQAVDSQRVSMLCVDVYEGIYSSVWQSFTDVVQTDDKQSNPGLRSLLTSVKVL